MRSLKCPLSFVLVMWIASGVLSAQAPSSAGSSAPAVASPDWAQPGSANHKQIAPPQDFHRPSKTVESPIGMFDGQSDVGGALLPGSATYDATKSQYTVNSAGYNIWYNRDEFRFLWKRMSGDASLAADISFPDAKGYDDRKAVVVIRQSLDDDAKEALAGMHGGGMLQFAWRPERNTRIVDMEYRFAGRGLPGAESPDSLVQVTARRIGIEKHGDSVALWVGIAGEPMHQFGPPIKLDFDGPFYVGIGFCSHVPDKTDTAVMSNVVLVNAAGQVH